MPTMHALLPLLALTASSLGAVVTDHTLRARQLPSAAQTANVLAACKEIAGNISSASAVFYPPTLQYLSDIQHYSGTSTLVSTCSFEPATEADVSAAFKVISARRPPFGIKSGGHSNNAGWSGSYGIQISLTRFNKISYNAQAQTTTFGFGLGWDGVYSYLDGFGVSVVGGRVSGVGTGGYSLGGGYGWRTNQYGLTIDNILSHTLVLTNGTVVEVTPTSNPDLAFLLRGGLNNAGLVTKITMRTQPSGTNGQVWGGTQVYSPLQVDAVLKACSDFDLYNTDLKASLLCPFAGVVANAVQALIVIAFYDAATPPTPSPFVNFTSIPGIAPGAFSTRSFTSLVQSAPSNLTENIRFSYNSIGVERVTPAVIASMKAAFTKYGPAFLLNTGLLFNINPEPYVSSALFTHTTVDSVYPHSPASPLKPLEINLGWLSPTADQYMINLSKQLAADLAAAARADGQNSPGVLYPNYALGDVPLANIYGPNVARGRAIAAQYDPQKVMCLAGGPRLQNC